MQTDPHMSHNLIFFGIHLEELGLWIKLDQLVLAPDDVLQSRVQAWIGGSTVWRDVDGSVADSAAIAAHTSPHGRRLARLVVWMDAASLQR